MALNEKDFSEDFATKMRNRMATSFHKYGPVKSNRATIDFVANIKARLAKYEADGNTEWLVDAANFCMMEYELPAHADAHFRATSSAEAPKLNKF